MLFGWCFGWGSWCCLERSQKVKGKPPFIARRYGRPAAWPRPGQIRPGQAEAKPRPGRVEAESRPRPGRANWQLARACRLVRDPSRVRPRPGRARPSQAEPGRSRPSQAELGRAGPSWAGGKVGEYIIILSRGPTASCLLVISWVIASNTQRSAFFIATTFTIISTKFDIDLPVHALVLQLCSFWCRSSSLAAWARDMPVMLLLHCGGVCWDYSIAEIKLA